MNTEEMQLTALSINVLNPNDTTLANEAILAEQEEDPLARLHASLRQLGGSDLDREQRLDLVRLGSRAIVDLPVEEKDKYERETESDRAVARFVRKSMMSVIAHNDTETFDIMLTGLIRGGREEDLLEALPIMGDSFGHALDDETFAHFVDASNLVGSGFESTLRAFRFQRRADINDARHVVEGIGEVKGKLRPHLGSLASKAASEYARTGDADFREIVLKSGDVRGLWNLFEQNRDLNIFRLYEQQRDSHWNVVGDKLNAVRVIGIDDPEAQSLLGEARTALWRVDEDGDLISHSIESDAEKIAELTNKRRDREIHILNRSRTRLHARDKDTDDVRAAEAIFIEDAEYLAESPGFVKTAFLRSFDLSGRHGPHGIIRANQAIETWMEKASKDSTGELHEQLLGVMREMISGRGLGNGTRLTWSLDLAEMTDERQDWDQFIKSFDIHDGTLGFYSEYLQHLKKIGSGKLNKFATRVPKMVGAFDVYHRDRDVAEHDRRIDQASRRASIVMEVCKLFPDDLNKDHTDAGGTQELIFRRIKGRTAHASVYEHLAVFAPAYLLASTDENQVRQRAAEVFEAFNTDYINQGNTDKLARKGRELPVIQEIRDRLLADRCGISVADLSVLALDDEGSEIVMETLMNKVNEYREEQDDLDDLET